MEKKKRIVIALGGNALGNTPSGTPRYEGRKNYFQGLLWI